jgi:hypothetical protein
MKKMIVTMVRQLVGKEYLYFEDALKVKKSPHTPEVNIWGICVSPSGDIFLMDNNQEWYELEESEDLNYNLVIASLWARLKVISKKVA